MRSDEGPAIGDKCGNRGDADRSRLGVLLLNLVSVLALVKSASKIGTIKTCFVCQPNQHVWRANIAVADEVRSEDRVVHGVVRAN
jgi:hypothetical protein